MNVILYIAVILLFTKSFGLLSHQIGLPQVVGMVIAGLVIGPAIVSQFGWSFQGIINPSPAEMDALNAFSQVGVIMILFSSGLGTDIQELKKSGFASTMIALGGVIVPVILGTAAALMFMGGPSAMFDHDKLLNALFIGAILAATSVGITVETLRELGKLNTKVGTTILSAAIIDDVIGIIALSLVTSLNGGGNLLITMLKIVGFFVFTIVVGLPLRHMFRRVGDLPGKHRIGIFALSMCFFFAYCAEEFFGVAAITGAYMAGLMLSGLGNSDYIDRKILVNSYMIFSPVFFAYIGISADFSGFTTRDLVFGLVLVFLGCIGKVIGCGATARLVHYNHQDSMVIGCGMIARGEVALAVYAVGAPLIYYGADGTLLGLDPLVPTILLVVLTSIICPLALKVLYRSQGSATETQTPQSVEEAAVTDNSFVDMTAKEGGYYDEWENV